MKTFKILLILSSAVAGIAISSCGCCTGVEKAPGLRPLPTFNGLPTPTAIDYSK